MKDHEWHEIRKLEKWAHWLDGRFRVPGTSIRFGFDAILGLVPGIGDSATTLAAGYLILRARRMGVPRRLCARMGLNVLLDLVVGAVPVLGDLFDVGYKANQRNVGLIKAHFLAQEKRTNRVHGSGVDLHDNSG